MGQQLLFQPWQLHWRSSAFSISVGGRREDSQRVNRLAKNALMTSNSYSVAFPRLSPSGLPWTTPSRRTERPRRSTEETWANLVWRIWTRTLSEVIITRKRWMTKMPAKTCLEFEGLDRTRFRF